VSLRCPASTWPTLARCLLVILAACAHNADAPSRARPKSLANARLLQSAPDIALEVVDWGGAGPPLVFLGGLGSTAHVFDDFAPRFTDRFHVVGITRRGFGASAGAPPPNDLDSLVTDLRVVLDSLGFQRVTIVGHSIAGEEMTRFAEMYASRCAGLVYLDAAYDRSKVAEDAKEQPEVAGPRVSAADTASFASMKALHERVMGIREPESEIRASARFDSLDRYLGEVTADSLKARVGSFKRTARYDRAACPALAIFAAADSLADVVPYYAELDSGQRVQAEALRKFVVSYVAKSQARFESYPQHRAVAIPGNHFIFLHRPDEVARVMGTFLEARR
jgi:non-heme chloroperoxidase